MNAYLVRLPAAAIDGMRENRERPGLAAFLRRLRAVGIATEHGHASGVMPFAYVADGGDVANVVCRDAQQLAELLDGIEGAQYLYLGHFVASEALHSVVTRTGEDL